VLRPAHLAYYKTSAEYKLHRLLDLHDVHTCTPVSLKRHDNTFGVVSDARTFYLQAASQDEMLAWVRVIKETKEALLATSTQNSATTPRPIPIPGDAGARIRIAATPSPPSHTALTMVTSSESEDASPNAQRMHSDLPSSSPKRAGEVAAEESKTVCSGYVMKCGSKRRNWRKRWFLLSGEKLMYTGSHMVCIYILCIFAGLRS